MWRNKTIICFQLSCFDMLYPLRSETRGESREKTGNCENHIIPYRLHISIYFAYMFLPKWLTFYLTSLPQNKLLRSFAFTSSRIVLREHFCTLKYIPIQQGTGVCLHGSQARVKSTDPGPNHHLHNNKIKKILTPFFAVFCSQNINRYTSIYISQKI